MIAKFESIISALLNLLFVEIFLNSKYSSFFKYNSIISELYLKLYINNIVFPLTENDVQSVYLINPNFSFLINVPLKYILNYVIPCIESNINN